MIETFYKTSDGKTFTKRNEALDHEKEILSYEVEKIISNYHYFRFNTHRQNCKQYLRFKHMDVNTYIKNTNFKASRSQARKKLWAERNYWAGKVKEGETAIAAYKRDIKHANNEFRIALQALR